MASGPRPSAVDPARPLVDALQDRIAAVVARRSLERSVLAWDGSQPIVALCSRAAVARAALRVLITAGVHGNERCGPDAALALLEAAPIAAAGDRGVELTVLPLLNPSALARNRRRGPDGVDLNRAFVDENRALPGVAAVRAVLERTTFDLALDLHRGGARRSGFWVLQHGGVEPMARAMRRLAARWPVLDGDTRPYRMVARGVGASGQQATLKNYLAQRGVPCTATLEAPASLSHADQVRGLVELIRLILDEVRRAS